MTCIVGVVDGSSVTIGADSAGVEGWEVTSRSDAKVFLRSDYLVGFTTSFRMGQLIRFVFEPPVPDGRDLLEFMVVAFVPALRACLEAGGFGKVEHGVATGGGFLVGLHGRLFEVGPDYQVGESHHGYGAVGSGSSVALGALAVSTGDSVSRVRAALEAAERHNMGVRGPFTVLST